METRVIGRCCFIVGDGEVDGTGLHYGSFPGVFTIDGEFDGSPVEYSDGRVVSFQRVIKDSI